MGKPWLDAYSKADSEKKLAFKEMFIYMLGN